MDMKKQIDINCDMGESYGRYQIGNDGAIMPYITSCNIACGFHGGDPVTIERTIDLALMHEVRIGAHPGYPDLQGFGRREMAMNDAELSSAIKYQVAAIKSLTESKGGKLSYVKPHGALYNKMAKEPHTAIVVINAIKSIDLNLSIMGLAHSVVESIASEANMPFIAEGFLDRRYLNRTKLLPRNRPNAVINDSQECIKQLKLMLNGNLTTTEGIVDVSIESYCIHGDNPSCIALLKSIHAFIHEEKNN